MFTAVTSRLNTRVLTGLVAAAALFATLGAVTGSANAAIIPCTVNGPTVYAASSTILGTGATVSCAPGVTNVSISMRWYRNGVQVSASSTRSGFRFVTALPAGTRCIRGATYQPAAFVTASGPTATPAAGLIRGPVGRYCG